MSDPEQATSLSSVQIIPGRGWTRFTYSRGDMELLGVVQIGLQIGALARLMPGHYAQVNGDFVEPLNAAQLETALRRAGLSEGGRASPAGVVASAAPVVTVRKRRRIAAPTD